MMRLRPVWSTNLAGFLIGFGLFSSFVLIPQFVQTPPSNGYGFGSSVTQSGLFLIPSTLMMLIAAPFSGRLSRTYGSKVPLVLGAAITMLAFVVLAVAHSSHWQFYAASVLLGIGVGFAFASLANLIVEAVRPDQTGVATGMNAVMRTIGGAIGGQVAASLLAAACWRTGTRRSAATSSRSSSWPACSPRASLRRWRCPAAGRIARTSSRWPSRRGRSNERARFPTGRRRRRRLARVRGRASVRSRRGEAARRSAPDRLRLGAVGLRLIGRGLRADTRRIRRSGAPGRGSAPRRPGATAGRAAGDRSDRRGGWAGRRPARAGGRGGAARRRVTRPGCGEATDARLGQPRPRASCTLPARHRPSVTTGHVPMSWKDTAMKQLPSRPRTVDTRL